MKRNSKRRLLSLFLVFVLCLSMIPTPALAEETTGNNTCQHEGGWTNGKCNDCGFECPHEDANVIDGECTVCGSVVYTAQNTTTGVYYEQLDEALNQASDGDTVRMLRDIEKIANVEVYDKSITLDLNGKNCTYGFIYTGNDDKGKECGGALKVRGQGNLYRIVMRADSKLDLTEWEGEIDYISCQYNAVITTKNMSGKIKKLVLYGVPDDNNGMAFDGGSFGIIQFMAPMNNVTSTNAGSLLADGYAFKNEDGTFVPYDHTLKNAQDNLNNVTVVKCSAHYDANGDEKCDYCNTDITSFAITVTTEEGEVYYFATEEGKIGSIGATTAAAAVEYANEHNGTLKQIKALENGAYLSVVGADCTIDLNGQTIACITAGGPNLIVTGEGTVVTLNTESGSAKIYGGSYGEISLPVGTALGSLLPEGVGFQKTTDGAWLTEEELGKTGSNVLKGNSIGTVKAVNAPITNLAITAKDIAYCDELTATATADTTDVTAAVTYKWYLDGKELSGQTEAVLTLSDAEYGNVGTYTIKCVASGGGYTVIKETTVTVNPADLANATLKITNEDNLIYTPFTMDKDSGCIFDVAYELGYKGKLLSAADHTVTGIDNVKYAGTYTLTVTGKGNYTGTKSIRYEVKPQVLSHMYVGNLIKIYDGTTDIPLNLLDNAGFIETRRGNQILFERGTDYTVEANYDTPEAGYEKTVTLRVKMLNKNFIFENDQREKEYVRPGSAVSQAQSIQKVASSPQSADLAVLNDHKKTYTIELAKLLSELPAPREYGDITYGTPVVELNNYYDNDADGAKIENGILSLPIEKVDTDAEGNIGTITIAVSTTNYEDMTLTIHVKASNKPVPAGAPTLSKTTLSYGEKLSNIALSGSMTYENETVEGTFTWKNPEERPDVETADAAWIFTPDNDEYAVAEGQTVISVQKAVPQVTAVPVVAERVYNPLKALLDSDLTGGKVTDVNGSLLAGTWSWQSAGVVPSVDNNGYTAVFTPEDNTRYETVTRTVTVNVTKATPVILAAPTASDITDGESLAASVLSGGTAVYSDSDNTVISGTFQWLNGSLLPGTADSNVTKYPVLFVPADTVNYETAQTEITVKVQQAPVVTSTPMPTSAPTSTPAGTPTSTPAGTPTSVPTSTPTSTPTSAPTSVPTSVPTSTPTSAPISTPTSAPTSTPTSTPTTPPSTSPTIEPSIKPTAAPNTSSATKPGAEPTIVPSAKAPVSPSAAPSIKPSEKESIPNSAKMAKVNKIKLKNIKKKTVLVVIGRVNNAALYKIQYSTDKRFKKSVKSKKTSKLSCKLTKLKKGKTYWIRVCAVNGKIQGKWSKTRKIKIRK